MVSPYHKGLTFLSPRMPSAMTGAGGTVGVAPLVVALVGGVNGNE